MPELPEVETIKKSLEKKIIGKKIARIDILFAKQFKGNIDDVINTKIISLQRSGKVLSINLSNHKFLNFHLKLSGQIMYADDVNNANYKFPIPLTGGATKLPASSTRVIIYFSDNSGLFFNESRKFGWIKVTDQPETQKGIDIMSSDFTLEYFKSKLNSSRPIKIVIMDQDRFAGIGNIYASEILFDAGIDPKTLANKISTLLIKPDKSAKPATSESRLYNSIIKIINLGIKYNGSSGRDDNYVLPDGSRGQYQQHFKVYQRDDKPCLVCKRKIKRLKQSGRSSFYCLHCQR